MCLCVLDTRRGDQSLWDWSYGGFRLPCGCRSSGRAKVLSPFSHSFETDGSQGGELVTQVIRRLLFLCVCVVEMEAKRRTSTVTEPRRARGSTSDLATAECAPVLECTWGPTRWFPGWTSGCQAWWQSCQALRCLVLVIMSVVWFL